MSQTNQTGNKLFAVYLGGRAPRCNTELHDVVFVVGESIETSYERLMDKWFGDPLRLHIDSWIELHCVDGYRISLRPSPAGRPARNAISEKPNDTCLHGTSRWNAPGQL